MNYYDNFYEGLNDNRNMLYRQIDTVSNLNKLLSTLCSEIHNLNNYKINVKGENSFSIKHKLKEVTDKLLIYEDEIREIIKIKNGFPIFEFQDIENISLIKTLASQDYKPTTIISNVINEFNILKKIINDSITSSQKENDYQTIIILSNLLYELNKVLLHYNL